MHMTGRSTTLGPWTTLMDNLMDGYAPVHEVSQQGIAHRLLGCGYIKTPDAAAGLALLIQGEFYSEKCSGSSYINLNQFLPLIRHFSHGW